MKKIFLLALCIFLVLAACAQADTKRITAFGDRLSIAIPTDVDTMSAEKMQMKYHKSPDGKSKFYSNADVDFSIVLVPVTDGVKEDDMVKHKEELISAFAAKGYTLEENTVKKVNGHSLIVVSFYSDVPGGKVFNRRFFGVVGTQLVLVTYNSYGEELEKRKLQIEQSINSVIIK